MQRDSQIDSLKFFLIFIVIFGHFIEGALNNEKINYIYRIIYVFHMPAFIFLSGMFSSEILNSKKINSILTTIFIPLIIHQFIFQITLSKFNINNYSYNFIIPYWGLWYLLSLFCWRLMLPLFSELKHPLLISIIISVFSGFAPYINYNWSLSRTLTFFPFFLAGFLWQKNKKSNSAIPQINLLTMFIGWLLVGALAWYSFRFDPRWLYMSLGFQEFNINNIEGAALRLIQLSTGFIGVFCIFKTFFILNKVLDIKLFAILGQYSIAAYILHLYTLVLARKLGLNYFLSNQGTGVILLISIASSLAMAMIFAYIGKKIPWLFNFSWLKITKKYSI